MAAAGRGPHGGVQTTIDQTTTTNNEFGVVDGVDGVDSVDSVDGVDSVDKNDDVSTKFGGFVGLYRLYSGFFWRIFGHAGQQNSVQQIFEVALTKPA